MHTAHVFYLVVLDGLGESLDGKDDKLTTCMKKICTRVHAGQVNDVDVTMVTSAPERELAARTYAWRDCFRQLAAEPLPTSQPLTHASRSMRAEKVPADEPTHLQPGAMKLVL